MESRKLKEGYTTGSCAAAASWAAAAEFYGAGTVSSVTITLPDGSRARFDAEKVDVPFCCYRVQKDAGDDPDVTDGVYVYASCRLAGTSGEVSGKESAIYSGRGYLMEGDPLIYIDGGPGIGMVTREGLSCPVGHVAVNPAPRMEIAGAVRDACEHFGAPDPDDKLIITISIPGGEEIAKKTFNPRLGIEGGISVLGTTGIVRPMSEEALLETIRLELHMRAVSGKQKVILTLGNYGEIFLKERFRIPVGTAVIISNFVKDSVLMAADEGFKGLLLAGHLGKLIKVAAGFANTHSRYGDMRMETFLSILDELQADADMMYHEEPPSSYKEVKERRFFISPDLRERIMNANTTDDALGILSAAFPDESGRIAEAFLDLTAQAVSHQLRAWTDDRLLTEVMVFSRDGSMGATKGIKALKIR